MPFVVIPNNLVADELISSAGLNANFNAIANTINGNIDTTNINPSDGINISVLTGFSAVLGTTGTLTLPGGLIVKWGSTSCAGNGSAAQAVVFGNSFPNNIFGVVHGVQNNYLSNAQAIIAQHSAQTITGFNLTASGASTAALIPIFWIAFGN